MLWYIVPTQGRTEKLKRGGETEGKWPKKGVSLQKTRRPPSVRLYVYIVNVKPTQKRKKIVLKRDF